MTKRTDHPPGQPTPARSVTDPECGGCGQTRTKNHACGRGTSNRLRPLATAIAATALLGLAACTPTSSHHHVVHHTVVHHVVHHHVTVRRGR